MLKIGSIEIYNSINKKNVANYNAQHLYFAKNLKNDVFVPSFSAKNDEDKSNKSSLAETLLTCGIAGAPFIIGIGIATAANPDDVFLSDGTYLGKAKDIGKDVVVDTQGGIIKIPEANIDIAPSRFTNYDVSKGIYSNPDKNIDIDLQNGKYIDPENGIFINPQENLSCFLKDGELHDIDVNCGLSMTSLDPVDHFVQHPEIDVDVNTYIKETGTIPSSDMVDDGMVHTTLNYDYRDNLDKIKDKISEVMTGQKEFVKFNEPISKSTTEPAEDDIEENIEMDNEADDIETCEDDIDFDESLD